MSTCKGSAKLFFFATFKDYYETFIVCSSHPHSGVLSFCWCYVISSAQIEASSWDVYQYW